MHFNVEFADFWFKTCFAPTLILICPQSHGNAKFSEKLLFLQLTRTCTCAYQAVRNVSFSVNFAQVRIK